MKKKGIKKILGVVLALAMAVSCFGLADGAANAEDDTGSIEITNVASNAHTFSAYQIFAGSVSGDTIGNITWSSGVIDNIESTQVNSKTVYEALADVSVDIEGTPTNVFKSSGSALTSAAEVAAVLATYNTNTAVLEAFCEVMEDYLGSAAATTSTATEVTGQSSTTYKYTLDNLDPGYYLVLDTTETLSAGDARTAYIVQVVGAATINTKEVAPSITKKIVETAEGGGTTTTNATSASAGETVTFQLTAQVPSDLSAYSSYTFTMTDTLSKNLTFDENSIQITYSGSNVNNDSSGTISSDNSTSPNAGTYTLETSSDENGTTLTIKINGVSSTKLQNATITVTYTATLSSEAVAGTAETNEVYLTYSSNPSDATETNTTEKQKVYVYTYNLEVTKTDGSSALEGAKFNLYKLTTVSEATFGENETNYYTYTEGATAMTQCQDGDTYSSETNYYIKVNDDEIKTEEENSKQIATFNNLGEGTYVLEESTTPDGYNTAALVKFTVSATYSEDGSSVTALSTSDNEDGTVSAKENSSTTTLATTVVNSAGSTMPETGGRGRAVFYILGSILVLGAAILLITRRRMSREE